MINQRLQSEMSMLVQESNGKLCQQNASALQAKLLKCATSKVNKMIVNVGYSDELLDENNIIKYYKGLNINDNGTFLEEVMKYFIFKTEKSFGRLREPVNKTEWTRFTDSSAVNAFYNSMDNALLFPAGILQGVFFSAARPNYVNYGSIGSVIGHEITHGFDNEGRQFDAEGNIADCWEPSTVDKYLEKTKCIIEQFNNYTDSQVKKKINGDLTLGENIADLGGFKQAYRAYLKWAKNNAPEKRLPGLQRFSPRQMFWISVASSWCTAKRNETLISHILLGSHSPGEFRVRGPLSNIEEFANDFNCPKGSSMNPLKKCIMW